MTMADAMVDGGSCVGSRPPLGATAETTKQVGGGNDADHLATANHDQTADRVAAHEVRGTTQGLLLFDGQEVSAHDVGDPPLNACRLSDPAVKVAGRNNAKQVATAFHHQMMDAFRPHQISCIARQHGWRDALNVRGHDFGNNHRQTSFGEKIPNE
jgi:hypothetical protein